MSTLKLPALFSRFKTEDRVVRLIKVTLLVKTILKEMILRWKVTMDQVKWKKIRFGCF